VADLLASARAFDNGLLYVALVAFAGAGYVGVRVLGGAPRGRGLRAMLGVGAAALTGALISASLQAGHLPLFHRYELLLAAAWLVAATLWWVDRRLGQPVVLAVTAQTLALLVFFALLLEPRSGDPAPGTSRLGTYAHVLLSVLGCAAFTFAAGTGALYLWQIRVLKRHPTAAVARRLPPLETLDRINFLAAAFGFPLLLAAAIAGWAFVSRSAHSTRAWLLDPTVIVSLAGLLVYLLLFVARAFLGWRGRKVAVLSVVGFLVVVGGLVFAAFCPAAAHPS
jgi:ABC-type transport system involved in cytochrome c biogenesis permease subunit